MSGRLQPANADETRRSRCDKELRGWCFSVPPSRSGFSVTQHTSGPRRRVDSRPHHNRHWHLRRICRTPMGTVTTTETTKCHGCHCKRPWDPLRLYVQSNVWSPVDRTTGAIALAGTRTRPQPHHCYGRYHNGLWRRLQPPFLRICRWTTVSDTRRSRTRSRAHHPERRLSSGICDCDPARSVRSDQDESPD